MYVLKIQMLKTCHKNIITFPFYCIIKVLKIILKYKIFNKTVFSFVYVSFICLSLGDFSRIDFDLFILKTKDAKHFTEISQDKHRNNTKTKFENV